jgi:MoCo/4Fe-4S cofactor protein with predicted Tat translocation signal
MAEMKKYWNGLEDLEVKAQEPLKKDEFVEDLPLGNVLSEDSEGGKQNRRDFLKIFGFGLTAATLAACETPLKKAIPFVNKPENLTPGIANYYASTCGGCAAGCGILVKTREGRPIKIEGNPLSHSKGGVCGTGQGTVLSLYDAERLRYPRKGKDEMAWGKIDAAIIPQLKDISAGGGKIYVVTGTENSPSGEAMFGAFATKFPGTTWVPFDAISYSGLAKAHERTLGYKIIPTYHFEKAEVVVSFEADFLGTWLSPVEFTKGYVQKRKLFRDNPEMSWHIQFESRVSLTGSNADRRVPMAASKEGLALMNLYNKVANELGRGSEALEGVAAFDLAGSSIALAAKNLAKAQGKSIVVSGSNDTNIQEVVSRINMLLGNYGATIDHRTPVNQRNGDEAAVAEMMAGLSTPGTRNAVIICNANPVYNHPEGAKLAQLIKGAALSIAMTVKEDETSDQCQFVLPNHHYLESWNDHNPRLGFYTLTQPSIRPIFESRQNEESFLRWMEMEGSWYDFMRKTWETNFFPNQSTHAFFDDFWNQSVQDGVMTSNAIIMPAPGEVSSNLAITKAELDKIKGSNFDLVLYEPISVRDGSHANNPWLQEMPDPISKVTWENFVSIPFKYSKDQNLNDGDVVQITVPGVKDPIVLPVYVQPGQAPNTLAIGLGYGRTKGGKVANGIGQNAFPMVKLTNGQLNYFVTGATLSATGAYSALAKVQTFTGYEMAEGDGTMGRTSIEGRVHNHIVKETTLEEYKKDHTAGNKNRLSKESMVTMWKDHPKEGYHWAMAIDLNSCTGCSACIIACNAENNVPVVGKDEVYRRREMHWIRLDRYFTGNPEDTEGNLQMVHQPMLCQHCDNAPCETVCPVLATMHSSDGLNQQIYNRCIGTRYCANNCPYKVRRFNWFSYYENDWFDFNMNDKYGKLVLNPDVTVRARGVMEKCSFCVQRIQEKKLLSKKEGRKVYDGEIKTACQQSCPADAIYFGDINDPTSEVHKFWKNERAYHALEEVKTLPGIAYLTKVRNVPSSEKQKV